MSCTHPTDIISPKTEAAFQWRASWIEPVQEDVREEPELDMGAMFAGVVPEQAPVEERLLPCQLLRREFVAQGPVSRAVLRVSAHGLYHATLNGRDVTEAVLTPDFTSYAKFLEWQTYDVTDLVRAGRNAWGITLADGWWAGRISITGDSCQFGNRLGAIGQLDMTYADGATQTVATDASFRSSTGKYVYADLFIGEKQDLRLDQAGWDVPGFDAAGWEPCQEVTGQQAARYLSALAPQQGPLAYRDQTLPARAWWREGDAVVVDFGQVIAGRVCLDCDLGEGQELRLEHAEQLDRDGRFFCNIVGRNKDQVDVVVGRGGHELVEPDFTYHGFRYVRISGWEGDFDPSCATAVVIAGDLPRTGRIRTSNEEVNRLLANIEWSQRANMITVPTDCPQRERAGWTGDLNVFAPTATFFADVRGFLGRWLRCVRADQLADGQIQDYSPTPRGIAAAQKALGAVSSAAWGDAIVMVPWVLYQRYGSLDVLRDNYGAMRRWHEYSVASAAGDKAGDDRYVWDTKFHYGDWMFPSYMMGVDAPGPVGTALATKDLVATAYLAHTSDILARIARLLGDDDYADECETYAGAVRHAFVGRFYAGKGRLTCDFQGCYVLALAFGLLPAAERQPTADRLAQMIADNGYRHDVGFASISFLLDVLCDWGHEDVAQRVFFQTECPSWLYEVEHGATTIWESWAGIQPDGTVGDFSFNHYASGCVGDWVVRHIGGLSPRTPGYAEFDVAPHPMEGLDGCELSYQSAAGPIRVAWKGTPEAGRLEVSVPAEARAHVTLPSGDTRTLCAGDHELAW